MGAEASDSAYKTVSNISSSVVFLLGGSGSGVVYIEGGSLREYSSLDSSGKFNRGVTLSLLYW